jgi:PKD repeat protein
METINVPVPLMPNFMVLKNCVSEQTQFTDVTVDISDPIVNRKWSFLTSEIESVDPTIIHTFASASNVMVSFEAQASSGCKYSTSKNVSILNKPFASFTATPVQGGIPLLVQFSNKSTGATSYAWQFGDVAGSTSTNASPSFTYVNEGVYEVSLTAKNTQECCSAAKQSINANLPLIDAVVTQLDFTATPTGTLRPEITILNNGNVPISNIRLLIDIDNDVRLEEVITATIPVSGLYSYQVPFSFVESGVKFICVELDVPNDINPLSNRYCSGINSEVVIITPYPNPANSELLVEWIAEQELQTVIRFTSAMGREIADWSVEVVAGLNKLRINTADLPAGLYLVSIDTPASSKVFRVAIEH